MPAMVEAWNGPAADKEVTPDPPYPDSLSGYAPVKDSAGETVAIVGADITAVEIGRRLQAARVIVLLFGVAMSILMSTVIFLYCGRREAYLQLERMNEELQYKNHQLQDSVNLRRELSHMIVHDLRNSLTIILGNSSMLTFLPGDLSPDQRAYVQRMQKIVEETTQQMIRLLEDMLVLAKSEAGRLVPRLTPMDVRSIMSEAVQHREAIARLNTVTLALSLPDHPVEIAVDSDLLSRTIDNLLSNAIKHAPPSTQVRLTLDVVDRKPGTQQPTVRIRVSDEGTGVGDEVRPHLFESFASEVGSPRGSAIGLGLAFCKMAIEAHHGRIFLDDSPKGSVFVVEL